MIKVRKTGSDRFCILFLKKDYPKSLKPSVSAILGSSKWPVAGFKEVK
jgi:hypothetical protein